MMKVLDIIRDLNLADAWLQGGRGCEISSEPALWKPGFDAHDRYGSGLYDPQRLARSDTLQIEWN